MSADTLRGVFVPTLTPVDANLSIDIPRWVALSKHLLETGAHGLCPFGTTSEANSFSVEEREDALEQLIDAGLDPALLMPGTGCTALTDSVRLTAHAVNQGCGGVLFLPPFYYKGVSDEGLYRSVAETIDRVGDDRLRIYLYHIPPQAVIGWSLDLIERLITDFPQTVVGIKDSSGDWNNLNGLLTRFPGFGTFTGSELFFLKVLKAGGAGTINAVANLISPIQRTMTTRMRLRRKSCRRRSAHCGPSIQGWRRSRPSSRWWPTIATMMLGCACGCRWCRWRRKRRRRSSSAWKRCP